MHYDEASIEGRFLAGDKEAIGEVVRWIAGILASPSFWSVRSEWEDLHQESLGRIVGSLRSGRFDSSRDFRAYVRGVARLTALQAATRAMERRRKSGDVRAEVAAAANPESPPEERRLVRAVLDALPEECRRLIRAYFFEGRSYPEISEREQVPLGTVKSRLSRCMKRGRRLFGLGR